jgi:hypothetical protein
MLGMESIGGGIPITVTFFFINAILKTLQIALYKYKIQVYFLIFTIFVVNLSQHRKIQRHKGNKRR